MRPPKIRHVVAVDGKKKPKTQLLHTHIEIESKYIEIQGENVKCQQNGRTVLKVKRIHQIHGKDSCIGLVYV